MERGSFPCSALTFVRNGGDTFRACLDSCLFCAEHIFLDGGSDDGTVELALEYGCTVIPQDVAHLDENGLIIDYASITNQGVDACSQPWILINSADEELSSAVQEHIMEIVSTGVPSAYLVLRKYVLRGNVIDCASSYPNQQMRLFHKDAVTTFEKIIHERPVFADGVTPLLLRGVQYIPIDDDIAKLKRKYKRYISLEVRRFGSMGYGTWWRIFLNRVKAIFYRLMKILLLRLRHPRKKHLPLRLEWINIWYAWRLIWQAFPR